MLPDFDDDPATESLDHLEAPFPAHLDVVRELERTTAYLRYEAVHTVLERVSFLEVAHRAGCERFDRWLDRHRRLDQAGVSGLLDAGLLADGRQWCLRARPVGRPLDEQVRSMTTSAVVVVFHHLAALLAHAHRAGFGHGALTAGSILVSPAGRVSVCDWVDGTPSDDVRTLAGLLSELLKGNLPGRLAVVVKRASSGGYADAGAFADALADVLQVR